MIVIIVSRRSKDNAVRVIFAEVAWERSRRGLTRRVEIAEARGDEGSRFMGVILSDFSIKLFPLQSLPFAHHIHRIFIPKNASKAAESSFFAAKKRLIVHKGSGGDGKKIVFGYNKPLLPLVYGEGNMAQTLCVQALIL